jgi:lipopolysaccharide transport system permease protein
MTTSLNAKPAVNIKAPNQIMSEHAVVIEPTKGWAALRLVELWRFREHTSCDWRDLKVRYKQAALGASWAILQPLLTTVLFTVIFGRVAGLSSGGYPYPVFTFTALLAWNYFANSFTQSGNSLVNNQQLISKVYFPRLIVPAASTLVGLVDFAIAFVVLIVIMLVYRVAPTWNILALPLFLVMAIIAALGLGLWLSAMNVQYRDIRYVIPFLAQFWMYATPIVWPITMFPEEWRWVLGFNPMTGVVEGLRWSILGSTDAPLLLFLISFVVSVILFFTGMVYFRRMERSFADII